MRIKIHPNEVIELDSPLETNRFSLGTGCNDALFVSLFCSDGRVVGIYNEESGNFRVVKTDENRKVDLYINERVVFDSQRWDDDRIFREKLKSETYWWSKHRSVRISDYDGKFVYGVAFDKKEEAWSRVSISVEYLLRPMKVNEIEHELDEVRKELGFVKGARIKGISSGSIRKIDNEDSIKYYSRSDQLFVDDVKVYDQGQWAEIVSTAPGESEEGGELPGDRDIAVYCDADWKKEKVARIWGVKPELTTSGNLPEWNYVFKDSNTGGLNAFCDDNNYRSPGKVFMQNISFSDFCRSYGEEPVPDFVYDKDNDAVVEPVYWTEDSMQCVSELGSPVKKGRICPVDKNGNVIEWWEPATKKEFEKYN